MAVQADKTLTVSELTRRVKGLLEQELGTVWVRGEISNFRSQASGHWYFTLKDATSQLSAVMFRGAAAKVSFKPGDGQQVIVCGDLTVYEARGQYQIVCRTLQQAGLGELQQKFEELKRRLQAEGLFDSTRKRPIPAFPKAIGIITSPTGAALQDMLNVARRRYPSQRIVIYPVKVQGQGAAEEVADALDEMNRRAQVDVIIVARGGGSLEDLWAFNEEIVARALVRSRIPTVSGVGHEIDFTICDFVADLRAPTPSAAAELVVPNAEEWLARVKQWQARLSRETDSWLENRRHLLERFAASYVFREPTRLIGNYQQRVDEATGTLESAFADSIRDHREEIRSFRERLQELSPVMRVSQWRQRLALATFGLKGASSRECTRSQVRVGTLIEKLKLLNPRSALDRGYSLVRDSQGRLVRSLKQVNKGDWVKTSLADGDFESVVK